MLSPSQLPGTNMLFDIVCPPEPQRLLSEFPPLRLILSTVFPVISAGPSDCPTPIPSVTTLLFIFI